MASRPIVKVSVQFSVVYRFLYGLKTKTTKKIWKWKSATSPNEEIFVQRNSFLMLRMAKTELKQSVYFCTENCKQIGWPKFLNRIHQMMLITHKTIGWIKSWQIFRHIFFWKLFKWLFKSNIWFQMEVRQEFCFGYFVLCMWSICKMLYRCCSA